jgi:hypothetical protein
MLGMERVMHFSFRQLRGSVLLLTDFKASSKQSYKRVSIAIYISFQRHIMR